MSKIDLHRLDLNLLVTFEVLIAAGRRSIQRVVAPPEPFDPATSRRVFKIAVPAFSALVSAVCERVQAVAPHVSMEWTLLNVHAPAAVADGQIDIAHLGGNTRLPDGVEVHEAQPFSWPTFVRKGHPALRKWDVQAWTTWPHVVVSVGDDGRNPTDEVMSRLGVRRTIGARIPDFSGVAPLLARSNMLGTFPPLAMVDDMHVYGLCALQPPVSLPQFTSRFFWSSRLANDPGNRWIRGIVLEIYGRLQRRAEATLSCANLNAPPSALRH